MRIADLEIRILRVESLLILLTIGAIASGDFLFGEYISLGYLYLVPLSYSALTHRLRTTIILLALCLFLRQWLGPIEFSSWGLIIRDWVLTGIFLSLVTALNRLGSARREFFETARRQRDELVNEVKRAAEVQQDLLDRHVPPASEFDIVAKTIPARVVGGDYYDFLALDAKGSFLGIVIADVAGKGLPAALLMPAVQIALRAVATSFDTTSEILRELNQVLYDAIERASYVTLFFATLKMDTGKLTYSNAGHQPVLHLKASGKASWLRQGGTPVGLLPAATYETGEITLEKGDVLVFYTDGIIEAENEEQEQFGADRLLDLVRALSDASSCQLVDEIHAAVRQFRRDRIQDDDETVIALRR
jgi:serine phosphatase RsbU (regulator of sigma subunit)